MIYRVIGINSSIASVGLDISLVEFTEIGGSWTYEIVVSDRLNYPDEWKAQLQNVANISVLDYQLLHAAFGHYMGVQTNGFISKFKLDLSVHLIAIQGYAVFQLPALPLTTQLGSGACIAAETKLPVVSDLRSLDLAFGGQGLPIAAIAQKLLKPDEISLPYPDTLIIALMGVLRWREEANMLSSVTGARQNSIGGAMWLGTEA